MEPMTNDAMTKAEARAYELAVQAANDWRAGLVQFFAFDSALIAYGDARAVEAEIAALRTLPCYDSVLCGRERYKQEPWICPAHRALADAEQREKDLS